MPLDLNKDNFQSAIEDNDILILDFWAPWCGPCKSFGPIFEKVAGENPDIAFAKINTEEEQELGAMFAIRSIPTLMIFREQIAVFSQPGALPEGSLNELIGKVKELDMDEVRKQIAEMEKQEAEKA
ncbi:thioredoxin [Sulfuriflexus mobilis]|uniref:thioredoxin n=1 Tax=Sulfuriflexus mobilis TaxID=1811807 RepID=UPI000F84A383|nr:thioredoxin [Sulfuriflexus mobilis]